MNKLYQKALLLSISVHVLVAVFLFSGDFAATPEKKKPTAVPMQAQPIQAVIVDQAKVNDHVKRIKAEKERETLKEKKRISDLENKANRLKKQREDEQKRLAKLKKERKQKEIEKRKADEAAKISKAKAKKAEKERLKKKQEIEKQEKAAAEVKRKKAEETAKKEKAQKEAEIKRKQEDAKRKAKAEKERVERLEQERILEQQMSDEMASRQQARHAQVMTEVDRYKALISNTIQNIVIKDRDTMEGKSCNLSISLATSGFVTKVTTGNGDKVVCAAAKSAVYKAGKLPISTDPEIYNELKSISLTYTPTF